MIDTHAHLDLCADPAEALLERARAAGVDRIVAVGSGPASCRAALALAEREPGVVCALGIHPHQAGDVGAAELAELAELLRNPKAVAVGETGLDHFRDYAPRDRQIAVFRAQIELAAEVRKPLVVHTRAADEETLALLAEAPGDLPVIIHCFSSLGLVDAVLERGYYASFAGNVSYPSAAELREAATRIPADRLLAETDCPYLAPQALRGRPNEPANVALVVDALAAARGESPVDLARAIETNAARLFGGG